MDSKDKVFLTLILILFSVSFYLLFLGIHNKDNVYYNGVEKRIDSLSRYNDSLTIHISNEIEKTKELQKQIDSLQTIKPKIITKYVTKSKEIDVASMHDVVNDFQRIFANNNIK